MEQPLDKYDIKNSRTVNVVRNVSWSTILQLILMILQFIVRTVFIRQLGRNYLGITGLFSDILWLLELANLRIPEAIMLCMYKPLAEKKYEKVLALIYLVRKMFFFVSIFILSIGLVLMRLLPYIIKNPPDIPEKFTIIFLFYLIEIVVTYLLIHKRFIIIVDQKMFIYSIYFNVSRFLQIIFQIVVLITIKEFYVYLGVQVLVTFAMNYLLGIKSGKMYPFTKEKNTYKLNKDEIKEIVNNIKSMFIYGLGSAFLIGTDNIIISSIIGIGVLGICSNYLLIINSIKTLVDQAFAGFTASIGNLNAVEDSKTSEKIFNELYFVVFAIAAFFSINLAVSINPLISVWLDNSYLLSQTIIFSLVLRFYVQATQYITFSFRSTLGLMKRLRYIPIITACVNIVLAIIMGKIFGVSGIFFASSIAIFFFTIIPEALLLYKTIFKRNTIIYFLRYFLFLIFTCGNYFITTKILERFVFNGWIGFFVRASIGCVISIVLFIIVFFKNEYSRAFVNRIIYIIKSKK